MPRPAKPWFRKSSKSWVSKIGGRLYTLGKTHEEARKRFHELKALHGRGEPIDKPDAKLWVLADMFLSSRKDTISESAFRTYQAWLGRFVQRFGRDRLATHVLADDVVIWMKRHRTVKQTKLPDGTTKETIKRWNPTTQNIIASRIKAVYAYAKKKKWIAVNPMEDLKVPPALERETVMTSEQYAAVLAKTDGEFRDLIEFLWETGCRSTELMSLSVEHVNLKARVATMPSKTTRVTSRMRIIYLTDRAVEVVSRRIGDRRTGFVFTLGGSQCNKDMLAARLARLRKQLGFGQELTLGGFRRTFATDGALIHTPHVLAQLLGHSNAGTVNKHYAKLQNRPAAMIAALNDVRCAEPVSRPAE